MFFYITGKKREEILMNHLKTGLAYVLISAGALTLTACGSTAIPDTINVQNVENKCNQRQQQGAGQGGA